MSKQSERERWVPQTGEYAAIGGRCGAMDPAVIQGDLLDQDVDVIVNAWNRNVFPWWLLLPQGVSGAIKRRAGVAPFEELSTRGLLSLGAAVLTGAGRLPFRGIIHVAGIGLHWQASPRSVQLSVHNALTLAGDEGFASIAFPLIGAGTGAMDAERVLDLMVDAVRDSTYPGEVTIVQFEPSKSVRGADADERS